MSDKQIKGIEAKFITYVPSQFGKKHDAHFVKEVVHYTDGTTERRLNMIEDYKRPWWFTQKGKQNHKEKKDYEYESNLVKYMSTQVELKDNITKVTRDYSARTIKQLARSPYLYGVDVSSSCYLKHDYMERCPGLLSVNTVAGGDIETNVIDRGKADEIICMSVTHKENVYLAYLKSWVHDLKDPIKETLEELERIPELVTLKKARNLNIEIEVVDDPAAIIKGCFKRLHQWKPDFFGFWNIDFDISKILKTLDYYGIDPADVFNDPSIPKEFRFFHYRYDKPQQTTASGVHKSKGPEDQWHWITSPATFQPIDLMATYRVTRLAGGRDSSYSLDYILKKELNVDEVEVINSKEDLDKWLASCAKTIKSRLGAHPYWSVSNPEDDTITYTKVSKSSDENEETEDEEEEEPDEFSEDGEEDSYSKYDDEDDDSVIEIAMSDISEDVAHHEPNWISVDQLEWGVNVFAGFKVRLQLNFGKLKFAETDHLNGIDWHREMQKNHKVRYGLYNIIDSIRLEQLDEKTNDLARSISLYSKASDFRNFNSNPKRLCDDMHFWYLKRPEPCVIGSSSDQMASELDKRVVSHKDWILTLPSYMVGPNGLKCVKDYPEYFSMLFAHVADLDIVSTYPNVSQILEISRENCVMEFCGIRGVTEHVKREAGVNLTGGRTNAVEITQKIFGAPSMDVLLKEFMEFTEGK